MQNRWTALFWVSLSQLLALSLWFSASAIIYDLRELWQLTKITEVFVSSSVPLGFIIGAFISAYFGIADRYNARTIFTVAAILGAIINSLLIVVDSASIGIFLRFLTGGTLAFIYPIAVKILALWFPKNRGLAIGVLIAALTLGSALPHVMVGTFSWKWIIVVSSFLAFTSAIIMKFIVQDAPNQSAKTVFSFRLLHEVVKNKQVMLANYGYFGHMWELYAMWAWLPAFFTASFRAFNPDITASFIALSVFTVIGVAGAIGSMIGGYISDKIGRAQLTMIALVGSGLSAFIIGFTYGKAIWLTLLIAFMWGIFVIADSAQFSAAVSEFAEQKYVGTALTFQMCIGFLITIFTILLLPFIESIVGWKFVFMFLCIGPIFGIFSMEKLRRIERIKEVN